MSKDAFLGIDMGATNIRAGIVVDKQLLVCHSIAVSRDGSAQDILEQIYGLVEKFSMYSFNGIGVGVPSVVDEKNGIVYDVQNLPAWKEVHLKELLETRFSTSVFVNNDANCFALGEKHFGKGREVENLVGLSIGSGLGAGLIINGRLYSGKNCGAGEVGMLSYKDGVMEEFCSGQFFEKFYNVNGKKAFQLATIGDEKALDMYTQFGGHLSKALENIIYAYDPDMIIIGGALKNAFPFYQQSMYDGLKNFPYTKTINTLKIHISETENIAVLGAAALVLNSIHKISS